MAVQLPYVNVFKHFGVDAEKNALRFFAAAPGSLPRTYGPAEMRLLC